MTIQYDNLNTQISAVGSTANIDINFTSKGTGVVKFNTGSGEQFRVQDSGTTAANYWAAQGIGAGNSPFLIASGSDTNVSGFITTKGTGGIALRSGSGGTQFQVTHTASAVNYVQVTGGATTVAPIISVAGSDTNIPMLLSTKGTSAFSVWTGGNKQFQVANTASAVNHLEVTGSIATAAPILRSIGSDTNIDLTLTPKGTGYVQFGTRTASADAAITGYIEIKDSGGTIRRLAVIG